MWVAMSGLIRRRPARLAASVMTGIVVAAVNFALVPRAAGDGLPFWIAIIVALIYSCCLGVTMDLLAYRPLRNSPRLIPLITAIGISLFLQNFAQAIWGSARRDMPGKPEFLTGKSFEIAKMTDRFGNVNVLSTTVLDITIIVVAIILLFSLQSFIAFTRTGKAMRACAQDRVTAGLMGIQTNRVVALAFALGAGLAAVAAPLYVLRGTFISPTMGYIVGILAFASAVLGGIGNIKGAMLGGLIIGIIFTFVPMFDTFDTFRLFDHLEAWGWVSQAGWNKMVNSVGRPGQYQLGVAYAFMIMIIVFKPTGLLGKASAKRA
jgi:branched-chain amino acid transport system permease protein